MNYINKIKDSAFFIFIGGIYCVSFSGINIGDSFFRTMENGYPLFFKSIFDKYPVWFGFQKVHFLNIPTLRGIQLLLAKIGLLPSPLFLIQMVNLCLALATLILLNSILLKFKIGNFMAKATTTLFAFSFGFYANMNGEIHHFSIFLLASVILLLLNIENQHSPTGQSIFIFSACLGLLPLYHMECIIYAVVIIFYIFLKKDLKSKFKSKTLFVILGAAIFPAFWVACSIVFHYFDNYIEMGKPNFPNYLVHVFPGYLRSKCENSLAAQLYGSLKLSNIYIMLRAQLESFSIVSRVPKILKYYKDIAFYSNSFHIYLTIAIAVIYQVAFFFVNMLGFFSIFKNWKNAARLTKLLMAMLITYLISFGIPLSNHALLSEFFITSALIQCILLGYFLSMCRKWQRSVFYVLVLLTIISNVYLYTYPQKISAKSINKIFNDIESENNSLQKIAIFRVAFFDFPYETSGHGNLKLYFDEHAYDSKEDTLAYLKSINSNVGDDKKTYLIAPGFLFGDSEEVNVKSVIPLAMEKNALVENLEYLIKDIRNRYQMTVKKDYSYNFGTLGQLGKVAVVELRPK